MRAVMLEAPESLLDERRRLGHDLRDELWDSVLHMVPPPSSWHQRFGTRLLRALAPAAESRGLEVSYETGVYDPGKGDSDYRIPDLVFARPERHSERGVEGAAELVIEILSANDESRDKLPFYARVGVTEVWLVDPTTRALEVYVLRGRTYHTALPDAAGVVHSPALDVDVATIVGPQLRIVRAGDPDVVSGDILGGLPRKLERLVGRSRPAVSRGPGAARRGHATKSGRSLRLA